jgi:hypothetical protein
VISVFSIYVPVEIQGENAMPSFKSRVGFLRHSNRKSAGNINATSNAQQRLSAAIQPLERRLLMSAGVTVTSYFDSAIYEVDSGTGAVTSTLVAPNSQSTLSDPQGLTAGPDGNLYISSALNNAIVKYNVTTQSLSTFIGSSVLGPIATAEGGPNGGSSVTD